MNVCQYACYEYVHINKYIKLHQYPYTVADKYSHTYIYTYKHLIHTPLIKVYIHTYYIHACIHTYIHTFLGMMEW